MYSVIPEYSHSLDLTVRPVDGNDLRLEAEPVHLLVNLEDRTISTWTRHDNDWESHEAFKSGAMLRARLPDGVDAVKLHQYVESRSEDISEIVSCFAFDDSVERWVSKDPKRGAESATEMIQDLMLEAPIHSMNGFTYSGDYLTDEDLQIGGSFMSAKELQVRLPEIEKVAYDEGFIFWDDPIGHLEALRERG